jgi:hypothetical protein
LKELLSDKFLHKLGALARDKATPLACPPHRTRKSIATYYYSNDRPEEELNEAHSTLFQETPGYKQPIRDAVSKALHSCTPPIIVDAIQRVRK